MACSICCGNAQGDISQKWESSSNKEVKTAGEPYKIVPKADREKISADGNDLSFITALVTDRQGNIVSGANHSIHYQVEGAGSLAGVDNGDPVSHESFKGNVHKALNGKGLAIVRAGENAGKITISAKADGLMDATMVINSSWP